MMKGQGYGRIINMTSMMSHISLPGRTAYSASKTALLGFNRALALELAGDQITVNGISPGVCDTEINAPLMQNPELRAQFLARIPVRPLGPAVGNRGPRALPLLRGSGLHHRHGYRDRRRLDRAVSGGSVANLPHQPHHLGDGRSFRVASVAAA